ncbi:glycosyltransferase [Stappia sp.]|uniref:glycosyltransferase n=1 Tax=Stappia sp. TaxID=1870903 RepID=UPI0025F476CB|nr:glycosyltransferase [Stappia sp.]
MPPDHAARLLSLPADLRALSERGLAPALLREGLREAARARVAPGRALLDLGLVSSEGYYSAVAEAAGVPFLPEGSITACLDPAFPPPENFNGPLVVGRNARGETIVVVAPPPGRFEVFARHLAWFPELRERVRIASPQAIALAVAEADPGRRLSRRLPEMSAARTLTRTQRLVGLSLLAAFATGVLLGVKGLILVLSILVTFLGLLASVARTLAGIASTRSPRCGTGPADARLPFASVLVPLYREGRVATSLAAHLAMLDYPRDRFEVLFLVEADDDETPSALLPHLEAGMRIVTVPPGTPRTKPRALAHGLSLARGEIVSVFDGEDRPEPDQIRQAATLFSRLPRDVAVLQAHLAIDHGALRFFPRQFLMEYSALFDCLLPWMSSRGWPIPLGGTSNHFRRAALEAVGGWDPHNVTEDADLAVRLSRGGYRMSTFASTTWEEAPLTWHAWHRQRTRWLKGWLQTLLVCLRDPSALLADMRRGTRLVVLLLYLAGMVTTLAVHPLFLAVVIVYGLGLAEVPLDAVDYVTVIVPLAGVSVIACYGSMGVMAIGGAAARGRRPSLLDLVLIPFYWLAQSAAFYNAVVELVRRPHQWSKTEHGFASRPGARRNLEPGMPPC